MATGKESVELEVEARSVNLFRAAVPVVGRRRLARQTYNATAVIPGDVSLSCYERGQRISSVYGIPIGNDGDPVSESENCIDLDALSQLASDCVGSIKCSWTANVTAIVTARCSETHSFIFSVTCSLGQNQQQTDNICYSLNGNITLRIKL